jgi:hypothetical protein
MANQNPNGRTAARGDEPRGRSQDLSRARGDEDRDDRDLRDREDDRYATDRDRARFGGSPEARYGRDDDRDDSGRMTDHYGQGQSGYGAGRFADDRSMGYLNRNQASWSHRFDDREGMSTDDRFTGRGGLGYWEDRGDRQHSFERAGQGRGYDDRMHTGYSSGYSQGGLGYGGYGQPPQRAGSQQYFRGGSGGAQRGGELPGGGYYGQGGGSGYYGQGHQGQFDRGDVGYEGPYGQRGMQGAMPGQEGYGPQGMGPGRSGGYAPGMQGGQGMPGQGMYGGQGVQGGQGMQGQGMRGTEGTHRGKGPQGYTRSDERIRENVCEALSDDDHVDASHIEVVVKNGEVILTGTVDDRQQKRLAEDVVERCAGVKDVQNQLRVQGENKTIGRGNQGSQSAVGKNETETSSSDKKHRA